MLERPELAGVGFGLGILLLIVGLIGVGISDAANYAFVGVGAFLCLASSIWWTLLRRR